MRDSLDEAIMLSDKYVISLLTVRAHAPHTLTSRIIQDLVSEVISDMGALYKASEAVRGLCSAFEVRNNSQ